MDDPEENEQREKLKKFGEKIQKSKTPKKSLTKTQKGMESWKKDYDAIPRKTPRIDEEKEEEKNCSLGDLCSVSGGKKSRKNKRRKRITRKFKKNRKFKKTSYKR